MLARFWGLFSHHGGRVSSSTSRRDDDRAVITAFHRSSVCGEIKPYGSRIAFNMAARALDSEKSANIILRNYVPVRNYLAMVDEALG
jgi:hypothetical protein